MLALECIDENPRAYARQLASYITDPSTIRARTLDMFGRGPTIEEARRLRQEAEAERERRACFNSYLLPKWDGARNIDERDKPLRRRKPQVPQCAPVPTFVPRELEPTWRHSWRALIAAVAADFGMEIHEVVGPSRCRKVSHIRHLLAFLMRERGCSFARISQRMGRNCHKAARFSCEVFPGLMKSNPDLAAAYRRYSLPVSE